MLRSAKRARLEARTASPQLFFRAANQFPLTASFAGKTMVICIPSLKPLSSHPQSRQ
jgi:hypothetical protein